MQLLISNPQNVTKDCLVAVPKIDLTVRTNGEENVMVKDAVGNFYAAGLTSPSVAATLATTSGANVFALGVYWYYAYVYVAKDLFPLVENAITGGGSSAPRSNPSPLFAQNSNSDRKVRDLHFTPSPQTGISHIWVYRSGFFTTAQEALDNANAGVMFWVGEVANNANAAFIDFADNNSNVGEEEIENDNFSAPQFRLCVYSDPYFYGIGNDILSIPISLDVNGIITIVTPTSYKWYNGRNGQRVTMDGVTNRGGDNKGTFYFKFLTSSTAQLYNDFLLTVIADPSVTGTTTCHIVGTATTLYRSKPRNPFSWGETNIIESIRVPQLYTFSLGGGNATALAVIPNLNLLKIDTENPGRCYTLNLRNAGTPNFESSLRLISNSYCTSNHFTQFPATDERGNSVLWSLDARSFSIVACDGAVQQPISSPVFNSIRTLSTLAEDRIYLHGNYCPKLELNCLFVTLNANSLGADAQRISCYYQHAPTGYWGVLPFWDLVCSAQVFDRELGEMKLIVGSTEGMVGEIFADGQYYNWVSSVVWGAGINHWLTGNAVAHNINNQIKVPVSFAGYESTTLGLVGNWMEVIIGTTAIPSGGVVAEETYNYYYGKIQSVAGDVLTLNNLTVFHYYGVNNSYQSQNLIAYNPAVHSSYRFYIGMNEMSLGKTFNISKPFDRKKFESFLSSWRIWNPINSGDFTVYPTIPTIEFVDGYVQFGNGKEILLQALQNIDGSINYLTDNIEIISGVIMPMKQQLYGLSQAPIPIDLVKTFGIILRDRSITPMQLMDFEIRFSLPDGNTNASN